MGNAPGGLMLSCQPQAFIFAQYGYAKILDKNKGPQKRMDRNKVRDNPGVMNKFIESIRKLNFSILQNRKLYK